jgi:hypothetical protein
MRLTKTIIAFGLLALPLCACNSSSKKEPATAALSSADVKMHIERLMVSDGHGIAIAARDGCLASISEATDDTGNYDEMRVRCPRADRMAAFFSGVDRLTSGVQLTRVGDEDMDVEAPAAQVLTAGGVALRVTQKGDAEKLLAEVKKLGAELQAHESPSPGPDSPGGWQLLHVSGPAHVVFAGEPLQGVLDARVSTTGQYLCEFMANTDDGPLRASKSGWIAPQHAAQAIDEVLRPFEALGPNERPKATYALGVKAGAEAKASNTAVGAVFERFGPFQDALGDACLPELEPPAPPGP